MPDWRGAWQDTALSTEIVWTRLRHRSVDLYARGTGTWERTSPGSYRAAQRALGRRQPVEQSDRAAVPLPEMGSVVEIDGIRMRIDPRMSEHNIRKLASGRHTSHERALLKDALQDDDRVLEMGGGIGMVAVDCARRLGGDAVLSFEPSPGMESLIRDNYALNGVTPTLKMAMIGETAGHRTFHVAERFSRSSAHVGGEGTRPVEVPVLAWSDEVAAHRPSVLVCDIQGGESEFFSHADLAGLRLVLVEIHLDLLDLRSIASLKRRIRAQGFDEIGRAGQSFLFCRR
ncbi:FkbM family methyltransferase [Palleronia sp.]|uniref:FkbM family methyltransferase n=1 Tax=Palleronia sp. TaxID=1940284 RepID=UPI0035C8668D